MALPPPSEGSTALVTGASSGIGAAIAESLARRGYGLTLVARREDRLADLASELHEEHGVRTGIVACDLADPAERDRLAAEVDELGLDVELLVNNAGFGSSGDFVDADRERQVEMVRVNCETVVDLSGRYGPGMARRGRGAIINVASMAAFQPLPGQTTYAATKAFVLSFTEALHHELKGAGVTVSAVCPGPVRTEFMDAAGIERADSTPDFIWTTSEHVAEDAVKAAEAGKRAVVPGRIMNAGALLGRYSPRKIVLPLSHRIWSRVE
jgi:Short-chain dehydrogenases of various substrate specificities